MAELKLKAETRPDKSTKKALSEMRAKKLIPGVVYGGGGDNAHVAVAERDLLAAIKEGGANAILHLAHPGGTDTVIVKSLQRHVVTSRPIHVDFQRIDLKKEITVKVPVHIVGEAPGVKLHGGVLEHITREIEVQAMPDKIPQQIELDVSKLDVGEAIHVNEMAVPAGVAVIEDGEKIIVNIVHATVEEEPIPAEGAEPEIIAKGKPEEGEEGKEGKAEGGAAKAEGAKKDAPKK